MTRYAFFGLASVLDEIKQIEKPVILDLGALTPSYFSYFSGTKCKIYAERLADLFIFNADVTSLEVDAFIEDCLLSCNPGVPFDVILSWDILNYLQLSSIQKLMDKLRNVCKPNTLFHTIRYPGQRIPLAPCQFDIVDRNHFTLSERVLSERKVDIHKTYFLLKTMSRFVIIDGINKEEGVQKPFTEQVLCFTPDQFVRKRFSALGEQQAISTEISKLSLMHRSPGIKVLCEYLKKIKASNLLDLGPKVTQNVDMFSQYCDHVYVEDLFSSLLHWKKIKGESAKWSFSNNALSFDPDTRFDAIVLWDLVNYLTIEQVELLVKRLSPYCRQGTRIFVMVYSLQNIPIKPQRFLLQNEDTMNIVPVPSSPREQKQITMTTLYKHLYRFRPDGAYVLQEGMRSGIGEYLLTYQEEEAA